MRETLSAPTSMQGLLRYFHRSRAASAEKHLCARGNALWTHIRNFVCKGKVGRRVGCGFPGGCVGAGSVLPGCLSPRLSLSLCCQLHLRKGKGFFCRPCWFPFFKTPNGGVDLSLSLGAERIAPAPFLPGWPGHDGGGDGAAVQSPHPILPLLVWLSAPEPRALLAPGCGRALLSPPPASLGEAVTWGSL